MSDASSSPRSDQRRRSRSGADADRTGAVRELLPPRTAHRRSASDGQRRAPRPFPASRIRAPRLRCRVPLRHSSFRDDERAFRCSGCSFRWGSPRSRFSSCWAAARDNRRRARASTRADIQCGQCDWRTPPPQPRASTLKRQPRSSSAAQSPNAARGGRRRRRHRAGHCAHVSAWPAPREAAERRRSRRATRAGASTSTALPGQPCISDSDRSVAAVGHRWTRTTQRATAIRRERLRGGDRTTDRGSVQDSASGRDTRRHDRQRRRCRARGAARDRGRPTGMPRRLHRDRRRASSTGRSSTLVGEMRRVAGTAPGAPDPPTVQRVRGGAARVALDPRTTECPRTARSGAGRSGREAQADVLRVRWRADAGCGATRRRLRRLHRRNCSHSLSTF